VGNATSANMTVAMITHQAPGDTFWDIIRKGAEAGAKKSNVTLEYSNDPDATKQAQLIQAADRQEGRRHRRHRPQHRCARCRHREARSRPASR
jgi:ABC-type sugar transport system substrate-binding protein